MLSLVSFLGHCSLDATEVPNEQIRGRIYAAAKECHSGQVFLTVLSTLCDMFSSVGQSSTGGLPSM